MLVKSYWIIINWLRYPFLDEKDAIFVDENMLEKILEFGRMQRNKFFFFLKTFSIFF